MRLRLALILAAAAICGSGPCAATNAVAAPIKLPLCAEDALWHCGSITVPLDRARPAAGTIRIAFYVFPHSGSGRVLEPIFITPGGPGESGWSERFFYEKAPQLSAHHDLVLIDPRGTGRSGAIDCPDLQGGWPSDAAFHAAVASCGRQLGAAAGRYGAGDVALDVDAVRKTLGYVRIDYYAFSYGTVPEQAYAARFPQHVHALVLDAGMVASDSAQSYAWGLGAAQGMMRVERLLCRRDPSCHADVPAAIRYLAARVRAHPVRGSVVVDEVELINLLRHGGEAGSMAPPETVLQIAAALRRGNAKPLIAMALQQPFWPGPSGSASDYSQGDNVAASCDDLPAPWGPTDPTALRLRKYARALAAFPEQTFAPFSANAWNVYNASEECLTWPVLNQPATLAPLRKLPTLIFSGDVDATVPTAITRRLLTEFPNAHFITVAGAGHPTIGWRSDCVPQIAAHFFATLHLGNTACAQHPV